MVEHALKGMDDYSRLYFRNQEVLTYLNKSQTEWFHKSWIDEYSLQKEKSVVKKVLLVAVHNGLLKINLACYLFLLRYSQVDDAFMTVKCW